MMEHLSSEDASSDTTPHGQAGCPCPPQVAPPGSRSVDDEFSDFYRTNFTKLVAYLLTVFEAGLDEATEAVQTAMNEVVVRWEKVEHPMAWCRTVAKRAFLKRKFSAEESFADFPPTAEPLLTSAPPDQQSVVDRDHMLSLVRRLPEKQREVIALQLLGLSRRDIAKATDATPAQVSGNLAAAKAALRQLEKNDRMREQRQ